MKVLIKDNEVLNDLLGYEGLKIIQEPGRFNFSLDSTLLAHFVTLRKDSKKILDLCTGNAPIPLMLTLRTEGEIVGVEIQPDSADQAKRSVLINGLEDQIKIIKGDLNQLHSHFAPKSFDVVTCNPPYFKVDQKSNLNKNDALTIARHEVMATLDDVVRSAAYFLRPGGRFAMVHRPDRLVEIIETFKKYQLEPKRLRFIYPRVSKEANGFLIEGVFGGKACGLRLLPPLVVYEGETAHYTHEILDIFNMRKNVKKEEIIKKE
ncbi:MAG: tRNA1(Val) (adenine(37)-N6)-methyltransferase [Defluviitaleaceae bacterium]|nr:tRNA1(Val) (adenine(37)-N6)-methyltransferase [Defluviitaleaceae bacterium]